MRYILSLALLLSACTRANPDAINGGGGNAGGGGGAAGSGGGGAGGAGGFGGGGGAGGVGGGGGMMGGPDLAMPRDMSIRPDMATLNGVACGPVSCMNGEDCCINNNGPHCTATQTCTGGSHPTLWACDGPEDCKTAGGVDGECCANSSGSACDPSCAAVTGTTPMCHSLADCPSTGGYVNCCPVPLLPQYKVCSTQQTCP